MKKPILTAAFASLMLLVAACNTVEGAGEDLQSAGSAVQDAAD